MIQKIFIGAIFVFMNICLTAQYVEVGPFSGAVSDSSAVIVYKISLPNQECRVEYSKDSLLRESEFSDMHTTSGAHANYIKVALKNLEPEAKYFYRLELNGEKLERSQGAFQTFSSTSEFW
jgi:phosphodiesterase/alkaline phosphatase D-like protein